jgi:hypothetical protein
MTSDPIQAQVDERFACICEVQSDILVTLCQEDKTYAPDSLGLGPHAAKRTGRGKAETQIGIRDVNGRKGFTLSALAPTAANGELIVTTETTTPRIMSRETLWYFAGDAIWLKMVASQLLRKRTKSVCSQPLPSPALTATGSLNLIEKGVAARATSSCGATGPKGRLKATLPNEQRKTKPRALDAVALWDFEEVRCEGSAGAATSLFGERRRRSQSSLIFFGEVRL